MTGSVEMNELVGAVITIQKVDGSWLIGRFAGFLAQQEPAGEGDPEDSFDSEDEGFLLGESPDLMVDSPFMIIRSIDPASRQEQVALAPYFPLWIEQPPNPVPIPSLAVQHIFRPKQVLVDGYLQQVTGIAVVPGGTILPG